MANIRWDGPGSITFASNDSVMEEVELGHINRNLSRLALNSNYGVNPTDYYFVGGRGNGKTFGALKRALEILQQPSSITVSKDCIPEITYKKNVCQDDFPVIDIDSIRRMMKEEEFKKMSRPKFKLGDKVMFLNVTLNVNSIGSVCMITGVSHDPARGVGWVYEVTRETHDGTTISFSNISECDLAPYTDYTSRYIASDVNAVYNTLMSNFHFASMEISKVIFNPPATIVFWKDGGKTVVKCGEEDTFDQEKGLAMAICKRLFGSNNSGSDYYDGFNDIFNAMKSNDPEKAIAMKLIEKKKGKKYFKDICKKYCSEPKPVKEEPKKDNNPCNDCPDRKKGCLTNCEKMQEFVNDIQTAESPKPIEPGYFVKHAEERKNKPKAHISTSEKKDIPMVPMSIANFVEKFDATMFPSNFLAFCKKNNLYFFIVDKLKGGMKAIDPYTTNWQQVTRYLKSGAMESCMKMKDHNINNSFLAVDMDKALFAKLPVELRGENRKEKDLYDESGKD